MKLYHGTSAKRLKSILSRGLEPRGNRRSVWEAHPSRADHVYLTNSYATHYARNAANGSGQLAVFEVDVGPAIMAKLYADEDAQAQVDRIRADKPSGRTLAEDTAFHRDGWATQGAEAWLASLGVLGTCSHHGVISPVAISAVALFKSNTAISLLSDPEISIQNYRLLAPFYRALTRLPFDGLGVIDEETAKADERAKIICFSHFDRLRHPDVLKGVEVHRRPAAGHWKGWLEKQA